MAIKPNPKIFEGFIDPNGGEWIRIKSGAFESVIWRPANMNIVEGKKGEVAYNIELLNDDIEKWKSTKKNMFYKLADAIVYDILGNGIIDER